MRRRIAAFTVGFAALVAGCTSAGGAPATAPPVTVSATTMPPATSAPTTPIVETTTTTVDRLSEIQAIYEDLEKRRLQAIYDQDENAFRSVYANEEYLDVSLPLFQAINFLKPPDQYPVKVLKVVADSEQCISAVVQTDLSGITEGGMLGEKQQTVELVGGHWGISYSGEDWACAGPHPLSG